MLNYDKTYILQFLTKNDHEINMQVSSGNRKTATIQSLKFLVLTIDTSLTWKHHIGELTSRVNKVCYVIRSLKLFMSLDVLRSTYFLYVYSIISFGIIFWGNSSYSEDIFKIQKRIIRIIMNSSKNASCWQLFKLDILPIQSQYYILNTLFVTKYKDQFLFNSQVHKINRRQTSNLYLLSANLAIYQNGVYYSGIKIYNHLPTAIKDLSGDKNKFKLALKRYSFCSLEEYFNT